MNLVSHKTQKINDGYGATFHRIYSIVVPAPIETAQRVMKTMQCNLNDFSPKILARFEKVNGTDQELRKGDEFQIHITGPWNGPVRVADVHERGFRFVTLEGHLEAGEIRFEFKEQGSNEVVFEIESLARSRDAVVDFVYDKIPIAKLAQTEMWIAFCKHFAQEVLKEESSEKKPELNEVNVLTERRDEETGLWKKV